MSKPVSPTTETIQHNAIFLQAGIEAQIDALLGNQGVSLEKDPKAYYKASRLALRGVIVAAIQRLYKDGANRSVVVQAIDSWESANEGWTLFLSEHPEVAAKVEAENKAKLAQAALHIVDDEEEEEEDSEEQSEDEDSEDEEDESGTTACEECGEEIPDDTESGINKFHAESCSHYPHPESNPKAEILTRRIG